MLNLIGSLVVATFMAIMPISTDYNNLNYSRDKTADAITKLNSIEKDENFIIPILPFNQKSAVIDY